MSFHVPCSSVPAVDTARPQTENISVPADHTASGFYISNAQNYVVGNAASGGWAGLQLPVLPEPIDPALRFNGVVPKDRMALLISGNSVHSSSWWSSNSGSVYSGGSLYFAESDTASEGPLYYNAGRIGAARLSRSTKDDAGDDAWIRVQNTTAWLVGVGATGWGKRNEYTGFEVHDFSRKAIFVLFDCWLDRVIINCRTSNAPRVPNPGTGSNEKHLNDGTKWSGFQTYDHLMRHVLTNWRISNCGGVARGLQPWDSNGQANTGNVGLFTMPVNGFGPEVQLISKNTQYDFDTLGGPEFINSSIFMAGSGSTDYHSMSHMSNWQDADGSMTNRGVSTVIAPLRGGEWWHLDHRPGACEAQNEWKLPMWTCSKGARHLGHMWTVVMPQAEYPPGGSQAVYRKARSGSMTHFGFTGDGAVDACDPPAPCDQTTSRSYDPDLTGPFNHAEFGGWYLQWDLGTPRHLQISRVQMEEGHVMLQAMSVPTGTTLSDISVFANSGYADTAYRRYYNYTAASSLAEVRAAPLGDSFWLDTATDTLYWRVIPGWVASDLTFGYIDRPANDLESFTRDGLTIVETSNDNQFQLHIFTGCLDVDATGHFCATQPAFQVPDMNCPTGQVMVSIDQCGQPCELDATCSANGTPSPTPSPSPSPTPAPNSLTTTAPTPSPSPTSATTACSPDCETTFVNNCHGFHTGSGRTDQEAYDNCRDEIDTGAVPIANACTVPFCISTAAMLATAGGGGTPPPTAPPVGTPPPTAPPVTPTCGSITSIVACTDPTIGECTCSDDPGFTTYSFYYTPAGGTARQYCFSVYEPVLSDPSDQLPVLMHMSGYTALSSLGSMAPNGALITAADRYNMAVVQLQLGGNEWMHDIHGTTANPRPCAADGAPDMPYLQTVFGHLQSRSDRFGDVYTEGFSQNSMWAALAGFCFDTQVKGVWQGGSGLARVGQLPTPPGDPCTASEGCEFWPIFPCYSDARPMAHCIMSYDNDFLHGSSQYMYDASSQEAHDTTVLTFAPNGDIAGGHVEPKNKFDWMVGCLGVQAACSEACAAAVEGCVTTSPSSAHDAFSDCNTATFLQQQPDCTPGCAPTLGMLQLSEAPSLINVSAHGRFGAGDAGLPRPRPSDSDCAVADFPGPGPTDPNANCGTPSTPAPTPSPSPSPTPAPNSLTTTAPTPSPSPTSATTACSPDCETTFVNNCHGFHTGSGRTDQEAYDNCRDEIDTGAVPIANACTVPFCISTAAMLATAGGGGTPPPTAPPVGTPPPTAPPVTPTCGSITSIVACTDPTIGECTCSDDPGFTTYSFYYTPAGGTARQYCFSVYEPVLSDPSDQLPVLMHMSGYTALSSLGSMAPNGALITAADRYNMAVVQLQLGGNEWMHDIHGTTANPRPCAADGAPDMPYLQTVFGHLQSRSDRFGDVYTEGFSQNSMWAALAGFCFDTQVKGVWQGGSGLARVGQLPTPPGDPCTASEGCEFWPIFPCYSDARPMAHCIMSYDNDFLHGSSQYMYDASSQEAHDTTVLTFAPNGDIAGGHVEPKNKFDWMVGCLGVQAACSEACAAAVEGCVTTSPSSAHDAFSDCNTATFLQQQPDCTPGCAPTLGMLQLSEAPSLINVSAHGRFGAGDAGLPRPRPSDSDCAVADFPGPGPTDPNANCGTPSTPAPTPSPSPSPTPAPAELCAGEPATSFCHGVRQYWGREADNLGTDTAGPGDMSNIVVELSPGDMSNIVVELPQP